MLEKILKKTIHNPAAAGTGWSDRKLADFRESLLAWYHAQQRELPWREAPSLYGTVVSEFMLQQTRVSTVLPYFERWMVAFPDFAALARAEEPAVLKQWEGLGYYSRARNLHKLARQVAELDSVPQTRAEWLEFPGVGPYASAAITSIAFGQPEAVVDGNVVRILARILKDGRQYKGAAEAAKAMAPIAQQFLNHRHPGDHNQAVMELGATVCLPRKPLCLLCPVQEHCLARLAGPDSYPRIERRASQRAIVERVFCVQDGEVLLFQHDDAAPRLAGLYELPLLETFERAGRKQHILTKHRAISNQSIQEKIYQVGAPEGDLPDAHKWIALEELDQLPMSGPHRAWLRELLLL